MMTALSLILSRQNRPSSILCRHHALTGRKVRFILLQSHALYGMRLRHLPLPLSLSLSLSVPPPAHSHTPPAFLPCLLPSTPLFHISTFPPRLQVASSARTWHSGHPHTANTGHKHLGFRF